MLSNECPSFLIPALPFALVSNSTHYIPNSLLHTSTPPQDTQIAKFYYKPHIRIQKRQLTEVRELGSASAEEWIKGLPGEGKDHVGDAIRWEQWEAKGGLKKVNARPPIKAATAFASAPATGNLASNDKITYNLETPTSHFALYPGGQRNASVPSQTVSADSASKLPPYPNQREILRPECEASNQIPWTNAVVFPDNGQRNLNSFSGPRPERSIRDVNEAKAARRADIERRCLLLNPPITANILNHMSSFHAATQIPFPLTDDAWGLLKSRLESQRPQAEEAERKRIQELGQYPYNQVRQQEFHPRESKDSFDSNYDNVQYPIRERLASLADEFIEQKWASGNKVTSETSPQFAAEVLVHVRERYYDTINREDEIAIAASLPTQPDLSSGPSSKRLSLENMKWLFDTKIKPLTEQYHKELFLCNQCNDNFKYYGFEGVVQHFAAKHTTALSMGTVVVYWRAEWPEEPPFNPNPGFNRTIMHKAPTPSTTLPMSRGVDQQHLNQYLRYGAAADSVHRQNTGYSPMLPGPYHDRIPDLHHGHFQSQFESPVQPQNFPPDPFAGSHTTHPSAGPGYNSYPNPTFTANSAPAPQYSAAAYPGSFQNSGPPNFGPQLPVRSGVSHPLHFDPTRNNAARFTELYQHQMDEMAKSARDVWFATSGIKDIPQSVRIYVVIQHMAARFASRFSDVPSLATFLDGLDNNAQMRPVRSLNGLACKTCVAESNTTLLEHQPHSQLPAGDRRLYTLPLLLNHFRTAHLEPSQSLPHSSHRPDLPNYDWTRDMIELPDASVIAGLINTQGMDDSKLELIAWAFPDVFPVPLPKLSTLRNGTSLPNHKDPSLRRKVLSSHTLREAHSTVLSPIKDLKDDPSPSRPYSASRPSSQLSRPSDPPQDDEYDPHKPTFKGAPKRSNSSDLKTVSQQNPAAMARLDPQVYHDDFRISPSVTTDLSKLLFDATRSKLAAEDQITGHQRNQVNQSPGYSTPKDSSMRRSGQSGEGYDQYQLPSDRPYRFDDPEVKVVNDRYNSTISHDHSGKGSYHGANGNLSYDGPAAADHFLMRLDQSNTNDRVEPPGSHTVVDKTTRKGTRPLNALQQSTTIEKNGSTRWRNHDVDQEEHVVRVDQKNVRLSPSILSATRRKSPSYTHIMDTPYEPDYRRAPSQVQTAFHEDDHSGRSPRSLREYAGTARTMKVDRHEYDEDLHEKNSSRDDNDRHVRVSQYGHRSVSLSSAPLDSAIYHDRSPPEENWRRSTYHVHSPMLRSDNHAQRMFYKSPIQERYKYVDGRSYPEDPYHQRIEYVPLRVRHPSSPEQSRYVIAEKMDQPRRSELVRLDETYAPQQMYERDGQLYCVAEPKFYPTQPSRNFSAYGPGYSY